MADGISGDVDLFGDPVIYRDAKVGRPEHVRTKENANKVSLLFACEYSVKEVAAAMGLSQPTFRKHYFHEIKQRKVAELKLTGLQLARLNEQAALGNVGAIKALNGLIERERTRNLSGAIKDRGKTQQREVKLPPMGKKEEQQHAAQGISGRFSTRAAPPSLVN